MPTPKPGFNFLPGPPPGVLEYLQQKKLKPSQHWDEVWREEHALAFTVAKSAGFDVLADIKGALEQAIQAGKPFGQFQRELRPLLQKKGWWGKRLIIDPKTKDFREITLGTPRRLKTIFQANIRTAHAVGQWERIQKNKDTHPYLLYELGPSREHRLAHASWKGLLLPADDPFWQTHFPPNGWGCKCRVRHVSKVEATRRGWQASKSPKIETVPWQRSNGQVVNVPAGIDPGWDTNPGLAYSRGQKLSQMQAEKMLKAGVSDGYLLDENIALHKKLAEAKGSNRGGLYQGSDGQKRYVKLYQDPSQSYAELSANKIYRELEIAAPEAVLVPTEGKLALASEWVEDSKPFKLNQADARRVLDGYMADVLLGNWDAVGANLDNIVKKGRAVHRVDNGGSLLFRAQGARKTQAQLENIDDWRTLIDKIKNPAYHKLASAANLASDGNPLQVPEMIGKKGIKQIEAIEKLAQRTDNFADLLQPVAGVSEEDRLAMLEMLRARAKKLSLQVKPKLQEFAKRPKYEQGFVNYLGWGLYDGYLHGAERALDNSGKKRIKLRDAELAAIYGYTGSDHQKLNTATRGRLKFEEQKRLSGYISTIQKGLKKLPNYKGIVKRGTNLPAEELAGYQKGKVVTEDGFTSASTEKPFKAAHQFAIMSKHGKDVGFLSRHPNEKEVLFMHGTRFLVKDRIEESSEIRFYMEEVD